MKNDLNKTTIDISPNNSNNIIKRKFKLVVSKSSDFQDVRCECGALLFKELKKSIDKSRVIEIKCRKCGKINRI